MKTTFLGILSYPLKHENIQQILKECRTLEKEGNDEVFFDIFHRISEKRTVAVFFSGEEPSKKSMRKYYLENK